MDQHWIKEGEAKWDAQDTDKEFERLRHIREERARREREKRELIGILGISAPERM